MNNDSSRFSVQLEWLGGDSTDNARIAVRSLRALAAERSGDHRAAAESLLVLEREHGDRFPKVWSAFAADRIVASQVLYEQGRYAAADSLLRFTQSWPITGTGEAATSIYTMGQLYRSRIAEALGNASDAVLYAKMFLDAFELAPPKLRDRYVGEAQARITRKGARPDAPHTQPIRPR
jgi:hypothetical protein